MKDKIRKVKEFGNSNHVILPKNKYFPGQRVVVAPVDTDRCPSCGSHRIEASGHELHLTCMDCESIFKLAEQYNE